MKSSKPLAGLTVIDFSAVFAGPVCSRYLLDCGADVIKIETPGIGDHTRGVNGMSRIYAHFNAGKRSIAVDLKHADGQALVRRLILDADIVIENFRPGIMTRFGLDYDTLSREHPGLIYCSISGFGQTGPMATRAAYAPIVHAASGFDTVFGQSQDNDNRPPNWEIMMADILTGTLAYGAVQTALIGRQQSGQGDYIDISMMDAMMSLIPAHVQQQQSLQSGKPDVIGRYCPAQTQDGFIMISIVSDKNLQGLAAAIDRPDLLADERFSRAQRRARVKELIGEIEKWSLALPAADCETILTKAGVPCGIYEKVEDLFAHPQVVERQSFSSVSAEPLGEFLVQNLPAKFRQADTAVTPWAATLGQHTDEILSERLQLDSAEINRLRAARAVS